MQADPLRRQRLQRRMEGRSGTPWSGLRNQLSGHLRPLSEQKTAYACSNLHGVMTRKELEARNEVKWETYTKKIQIEARVLGDLVMNHVVPVAIEYQSKLIDNVYKMKQIFPTEEAKSCLLKTWPSSVRLQNTLLTSKNT